MFVITAGLLAIVCGVLIGLGCWWPSRAEGVTVDAVQRRLAFESYCRTMESQWPARTEVEVDRERVLARLHAITHRVDPSVHVSHRPDWPVYYDADLGTV